MQHVAVAQTYFTAVCIAARALLEEYSEKRGSQQNKAITRTLVPSLDPSFEEGSRDFVRSARGSRRPGRNNASSPEEAFA